MYRRLVALTLYRFIFLTLFLLYEILGLLVNWPILPFFGSVLICGIQSLCSMLCWWYCGRVRNQPDRLADLAMTQFSVDVFAVSWLVAITGGVDSSLRLGYLFIILLSAVYLEKMQIYAITVLSLSFYFLALQVAAVLNGHSWSSINFNDLPPEWSQATGGLFVLCFVTAILSAFIQSDYRLTRRVIDQKELNIRYLRDMRRKIVESLPSGLLTCTAEGRITFVNKMGQLLLQRSFNQLMGTNVWKMFEVDPPNPDKVDSSFGLTRVERQISIGKLRKTFGISCIFMTMESIDKGLLFIFQDLTKIKILEEQNRLTDRMSAIGKMAAGVAHEIRNPLAAILGSIQVLRDILPDDETARELAEIVFSETERLNGIISQFLAYARPGPPPRLASLNLADLVTSFIKLTRNDSQWTHIEVVYVAAEEPPVIMGDEGRLMQVFWNLFRNSCHACGDQGRVEFHCHVAENRVELGIKDNGIGMTKEQVGDLFTPFLSFSKSGTGLGMSIVYEVIQLHQGDIQVASEVGQGTTVTLQFPRHIV